MDEEEVSFPGKAWNRAEASSRLVLYDLVRYGENTDRDANTEYYQNVWKLTTLMGSAVSKQSGGTCYT